MSPKSIDNPPSTKAPMGAMYRAFRMATLGSSLAVLAWVTPTPTVSATEEVAVSTPSTQPAVEVYRGPELPMTVNDRVVFWVNQYTEAQRADFERGLERRGRYDSMIRRKLRERGMPEDLVYLAMIESGFLPTARSHASAVGLWQFMAPTARGYGLRVDSYVDERRDPIAATDAALSFLSDLYDRYGSWYLAAAAYNAGAGRVNSAMRAAGQDSVEGEDTYWEIIEHLPRETRNYVPRILAARLVAADQIAYGFDADAEGEYRFDQVHVGGGLSLETVAVKVGLDADTLRALNPHLIKGMTPPDVEAFPLRVPAGTARVVLARLGEDYVRVALAE